MVNVAVMSLGTENTTAVADKQSKKQSLVLLSLAITLPHETESMVSIMESSFALGYLHVFALFHLLNNISEIPCISTMR